MHAVDPIQFGRIDLYHATTIPITVALLAQFKTLFYILLHPVKALRGPCGSLLVFVFCIFYPDSCKSLCTFTVSMAGFTFVCACLDWN